jgi:hypothetical protein
MLGSRAARAVLTLVLAVGMHLCCCRTTLFGCSGGTDRTAAPVALEATHHSAKSCCTSEQGDEPSGPQPSKDRREKKCVCESAGPKTAPEAPQHVNLAPQPLLAVLPRPAHEVSAFVGPAASTTSHAPFYRPCTTLLRQHCALNL